MADIDIHNDPVTVNVGSTEVNLKGLDNVKSAVSLATPQPLQAKLDLALPQPFKSEAKLDLSLPKPITTESKINAEGKLTTDSKLTTESNAALDIKPLAIDQCVRLSFGSLPPTCIRQPYQQRFGFTIFGIEIFGFNLSGETQVVVPDSSPRPQIAWGGEHSVSTSSQSDRPPHEHAQAESQPATDGLRIRLGT